MKILKLTITRTFIVSAFFLIAINSCTKNNTNTNTESGYGCDSKVVLETLSNTPGLLVYNPTQGEWLVSIDLGGNRKFSCSFCDRSVYNSKVAGQSTTTSIPVTVSGSVKRRYANQIPISPATGYVEVYMINIASVN